MAELEDEIDESRVQQILRQIGYSEPAPTTETSINRLAARVYELGFFGSGPGLVPIGAVPLVIFALLQSHRLFRGQLGEIKFRVLRSMVPLFGIAVFTTYALLGFGLFLNEGWRQRSAMLSETHAAFERLQPKLAESGVARQFSVDELNDAAPISERTRKWLRGSRIMVASEMTGPTRNTLAPWPSGFIVMVPNSAGSNLPYQAEILLANGVRCSVRYPMAPHTAVGVLGGACE